METHIDLMEKGVAAGLFLGAEVVAGDRNGVVVRECAGFSRPGVKWAADTIVDIASVTKAVGMATAALKCLEDGSLRLDTRLGDLFPSACAESAGMTLAELSTHSAGFGNARVYYNEMTAGRDIFSACLREKPDRPAGLAFEYSCLNMILMGFMVEAACGERLDSFCERHFFGPLGMRETSFGPPPVGKTDRLAKIIDVEPGIISDFVARAAVRPVGNAGLFSTVSDLALYCRMILNGGELNGARVLKPESVDMFSRPLYSKDDARRSFCWDMGAALRPEGLSDKTFYHSGWTGQSVFIDPEKGRFAAVLTNRVGDHGENLLLRPKIASAALAAF